MIRTHPSFQSLSFELLQPATDETGYQDHSKKMLKRLQVSLQDGRKSITGITSIITSFMQMSSALDTHLHFFQKVIKNFKIFKYCVHGIGITNASK